MLPISQRTTFLFLRNIVLPLGVALELYFFPYWFVLATMIVGGHAHFFMAYLYQFRAKKMDRTYLGIAGLLFLLASVYFFLSGAFLPLHLLVSLLFIVHFTVDEFTLHDETWNFSRLSSACGMIVTFITLIIHALYPIPFVLFSVLTINGIGILVRLVRDFTSISQAEWYLWFLQIIVSLMVLGTIPIPLTSVTSFIIILHFFNWMIGYGVKVHSRAPSVRNRYWYETIATFTGFGILYAVFYSLSQPLFGLFFTISAYYAWAIAHIVLSAFLARPRWG